MIAKRRKAPTVRYRALTGLSLRKRPSRTCDDWHEWPENTVFEPPPHMRVDKALERGIIEPAGDVAVTEVDNDV